MPSLRSLTATLVPRQILALDGVRDLTVRCASGAVWVSPGNGQDLALTQGMRRRVGTAGKVVIEGMDNAKIEVRWRG